MQIFFLPKCSLLTGELSFPALGLRFFFDSLDWKPNFFLSPFLEVCGFFILFSIFFFGLYFSGTLQCDDAADGQLMIIKTCH